MNQPTNEVFLDLRGLPAPEPMERVLDALEKLGPGQQVRMLIEREPHPLYRLLTRCGYPFTATASPAGLFELVIGHTR
ncbi:MAG: DUF2249 domain-containing protein [Massilia sp.]